MPSLDRHLGRWLIDLHAVEQQALFQLRRARRLVPDAPLTAHLDQHISETLRHRTAVRDRLASLGRRSSPLLDAAVTANRAGFLLYTASAPDAPGKLVVDSFAYEFLEIAAYRMLARLSDRIGDATTRQMARDIAGDEELMADRLSSVFDWAVDASRDRARGHIGDSVRSHLRDAHALEVQSTVLLGLGARVAGDPQIAAHLRRRVRAAHSRRHRLAERLRALGAYPSLAKGGAMALAGTAWSGLWAAQRYTPAKLGSFVYATEHLHHASHELLAREADRAGDAATAALARDLSRQARAAAREMSPLLERAADASVAARKSANEPPHRLQRLPKRGGSHRSAG